MVHFKQQTATSVTTESVQSEQLKVTRNSAVAVIADRTAYDVA